MVTMCHFTIYCLHNLDTKKENKCPREIASFGVVEIIRKNSVLILVVAIAVISFLHHYTHDPLTVISWDVYGYYLYLPAILKYGDWDNYAFAIEHLNQYYISSDLYQLMDWKGEKAPIYTIGMAVLYAPFYFLSDIVASLTSYPADGMSQPYQWGIVVASWFYMGVGIYCLNRLLEVLKFSWSTRVWSLAAIVFGSNYFHYVVYENGMSHTYLFTLYAILLYYTHRWHTQAKLSYIIICGLCISLLCIARPSEVISLLIPVLYGVYNGLTILIKRHRLVKNFKQIVAFSIVGISVVSIQVLFWKISQGDWIFNGYSGHHFDFLSPHIWDGLFSFRKGWLIYSPVFFIALLGFIQLYREERRWFWALTLFTVINIYIVLSWHIWWYASSYGMRALIQSYAILAIPMALFVRWSQRRKWIGNLTKIFIVLCICMNQFQDWQYRNGILLQDEMNAMFYTRSFLKTTVNKDLRKFIDNPEEYKGGSERKILRNIEIDTVQWDTLINNVPAEIVTPGSYGPTIRINLNEAVEADSWLHGSGNFYTDSEKFTAYKQARFVLSHSRNGENIKWRGIHIQRIIDVGKWNDFGFDFRLDQGGYVGDQIEMTLWNRGPDTMYVNQVTVSKYIE